MIFHAILALSLGAYCAYLALRVPDGSLSHHAQYGGGAITLFCALLAVFQAVGLTSPTYLMYIACSMPLIAGYFILCAWAMITLLRMTLNLRACAAANDQAAARRNQRLAGRR